MFKKFLNPKNDIAFKRIFGTEKNKDILMEMLNVVLREQLESPIKEAKFLSTIQLPESNFKKQSIVDVFCKDEKGIQYIVEMQVENTGAFSERAQHYACKAYSSQARKGGKYKGMDRVIFLAFTDFNIFPKKKEYKSEHVILDKKTLENDLKSLAFIFIDLVSFKKENMNKRIEELNLEEKFYYFLCYAPETDPEDLKRLTNGNDIIKRAYEELNRVYWTEQETLQYEDMEKALEDNKAAFLFSAEEAEKKGKMEGKEEGLKEGEKKGKMEIAKNLLAEGLDIKLVEKATGISKKQLEELK